MSDQRAGAISFVLIALSLCLFACAVMVAR